MPKKYIIKDYGNKKFLTDEHEEWTNIIEFAKTFTEKEKNIVLGNLEPMGYACVALEV